MSLRILSLTVLFSSVGTQRTEKKCFCLVKKKYIYIYDNPPDVKYNPLSKSGAIVCPKYCPSCENSILAGLYCRPTETNIPFRNYTNKITVGFLLPVS